MNNISKEIKIFFNLLYLGFCISIGNISYHLFLEKMTISEIGIGKISLLLIEIIALSNVLLSYPYFRPKDWLESIFNTIALSLIAGAIFSVIWEFGMLKFNATVAENSAILIAVGIGSFMIPFIARKIKTILS